MPGKIARDPKLAEVAKELRAKGFGFRTIAKKLNEEYGANVSHMAVKSFFDKMGIEAMGMRKSEITIKAKQEIKDEILNTAEQLKKINQEMWELYREIKESGKDKMGVARMNMLDKILRQLEFNTRQLGRITSTALNVTQIDYIDFATTITKYLKEWERQGFIKILKPIAPENEE